MNLFLSAHPGRVLTLAFIAACGPTTPGATATDGNTDSSGQASTNSTGQASTSSTGPGSSTDSTDPTVPNPSSVTITSLTESTLGTSSTGGEPTTGTRDPFSALEGSCSEFCGTALECLKPSPYPDFASCEWLCLKIFDPDRPLCTTANAAVNECMAALECPDFKDVLTGVGTGQCADEFAAVDAACVPGCQYAISDGGPADCSIGRTCPGDTPMAYVCSGNTCTCNIMVDGEEKVVAECPAAGTCSMGWQAQADAANVCCLFEL